LNTFLNSLRIAVNARPEKSILIEIFLARRNDWMKMTDNGAAAKSMLIENKGHQSPAIIGCAWKQGKVLHPFCHTLKDSPPHHTDQRDENARLQIILSSFLTCGILLSAE